MVILSMAGVVRQPNVAPIRLAADPWRPCLGRECRLPLSHPGRPPGPVKLALRAG